jgi:serine phosphatase RsbU (regulator of sigma subunit)
MPLLQNLETNDVQVLGSEEQGGLPLAIDEDWVYEECGVEIPENSRLLIYTDGLDEAFPADGDQHHDQFGIEGIIRTLKESRDLPLDQALERLFQQSNLATKGSGRHDDTSVVLLERKRR